MQFNELNIDDQKDILDLMCILSANCSGLYDKHEYPERTEEEILNSASVEAKKYWGEFLLSQLRGK